MDLGILSDSCSSMVDLPMPGSPLMMTALPGTIPPPITRSNSATPVLSRSTLMVLMSLMMDGGSPPRERRTSPVDSTMVAICPHLHWNAQPGLMALHFEHIHIPIKIFSKPQITQISPIENRCTYYFISLVLYAMASLNLMSPFLKL